MPLALPEHFGLIKDEPVVVGGTFEDAVEKAKGVKPVTWGIGGAVAALVLIVIVVASGSDDAAASTTSTADAVRSHVNAYALAMSRASSTQVASLDVGSYVPDYPNETKADYPHAVPSRDYRCFNAASFAAFSDTDILGWTTGEAAEAAFGNELIGSNTHITAAYAARWLDGCVNDENSEVPSVAFDFADDIVGVFEHLATTIANSTATFAEKFISAGMNEQMAKGLYYAHCNQDIAGEECYFCGNHTYWDVYDALGMTTLFDSITPDVAALEGFVGTALAVYDFSAPATALTPEIFWPHMFLGWRTQCDEQRVHNDPDTEVLAACQSFDFVAENVTMPTAANITTAMVREVREYMATTVAQKLAVLDGVTACIETIT